jgi:hypothetical protein
MRNNKRVLVAVDQSEVSQRMVAYVADMLGGRPGFHVGLFHLEVPPHMLEWGGSENPENEDRVSEERAETYQQMEKTAVLDAKDRLRPFQQLLTDRSIDVVCLLVEFEEPLSGKNIASHILQTAEDRDYGTVVVGRHLFSFWDHLFHRHVDEELLRTDGDITIWVVG